MYGLYSVTDRIVSRFRFVIKISIRKIVMLESFFLGKIKPTVKKWS